eukprot:TRINITY_DN2091_c0_g1_i12.p1 TRINITY_DN2091_c0_g1~~TRINITY_DN2091_c0_g1_i12.p1  ORF type:complete len:1000 (+),score=203.39 TRINITY_DN2091_c0_g1_i12:3-3002(+)
MFASFLYVWAAWLAVVTPTHWVRWPLMVLSILGAILVSIDQLNIASQHRTTPLFGPKFGMLTYQLIIFALYLCVFVAGSFGVLTSNLEQCAYAYSDAMVKVVQGGILAMIRNREGAIEIHRWWMASTSMQRDLQELLDKANVPIFSMDLDGKITQWNSSMSKLTGFKTDSVQCKHLVDLVSADCKESILAELKACVDASSAHADANLVEVAIPTEKTSDQNQPQIRVLAMTFVRMNGKTSALEGITAIGQDLSDLANMKVVQERKAALMAMLSHEIRSPLHGMMGLTDAMLQMPSSQPLQRQLGMVKGCSARLLDLVTNIMSVAQAEKMKAENVEQRRPDTPVDFGAIVDEACTMIGNSIDKTNKPLLKPGVRLENKLAGSKVPLVRGDQYKCTQMVYNFLTNACKFTQKGCVSVQARHLPEEKLLEIDVSDTGKGISEEGAKRIFEPFQQENEGDTRSFQGIGLGLSVCKSIAELHEGTLRVKSKLGHGSTFTISLPCEGDLGEGVLVDKEHGNCGQSDSTDHIQDMAHSKLVEPEWRRTTSHDDPPMMHRMTTEKMFGGTPLILSVDDDEVNQEVIKSSLSDFCEVIVAMSGPEALQCLRKLAEDGGRTPDLVLLDIQMPGMTGFEVCETIRTTFAYKASKLPVTMVSAKAPSEDAAIKAFDCGSTDYICKPFNREILKCKVRVALNMKAAGCPTSSAGIVAKEARQYMQAKERETADALARARQAEKERDEAKSRTVAEGQIVQDLRQELQQMKQQLLEKDQAQRALKERLVIQRDDGASKLKPPDGQIIQDLRQELQQMKQQLLEKDQAHQALKATHLQLLRGEVAETKLLTRRDGTTQLKSLQDEGSQTLCNKVHVPTPPPGPPIGRPGGQRHIIRQLHGQLVTAKTAIKLLASRLKHCSSSSKECWQLLQENSTALEESDDSCELPQNCQSLIDRLEDFRNVVKMVMSELRVVEESGSTRNLSGIETLVERLSTPVEPAEGRSMASADMILGA